MAEERGWELRFDHGPAGLLVKARCTASAADHTPLAIRLWSELQKNFVYRLLLELDGTPILNERLITQLVALDKQIHEHGGILRLCGLHERDWAALELHHLSNRFPKYLSRHDAIFAGVGAAGQDGPTTHND